jgi:mono/diheme cytochrome c family protein
MRSQFRIALIFAAVVAATAAGPAAKAVTLLERGTYLIRSCVACGNCHTPKGPRGGIPGMELAGMAPVTKNPDFMANAPNTTPDKETGIGAWTDTQIVIAIYEGRRPNGKIIGRPMPTRLCRDLSDRDVNAIVAYLRTVKLIRNVIPPSGYYIPPHDYGPPVKGVAGCAKMRQTCLWRLCPWSKHRMKFPSGGPTCRIRRGGSGLIA